jgi:hypothetical protein
MKDHLPGHDAVIRIMQIMDGKLLNNGNIVWGRMMRHKNVSMMMCSIGMVRWYFT